MIPLVKLKKEVEFNRDLKQILDALKGIALSRFHVLQRQLAIFEKFPALAGNFLSGISLDALDHPYVSPATKRAAVLAVTTDSGFLGGLNAQVITAGLKEGGPDAFVAVIGERGGSYLQGLQRECKVFPGIQDKTRSRLAAEVREFLLAKLLSGECGRLIVSFPKPISLALQQVTIETLLPCKEWLQTTQETMHPEEFIWESSPVDILSYVMTFWIEHRLDEIFAMSRVSELGARVMHLEGSFQELTRQGKKLNYLYFKTRHGLIDRSMREVSSAQLFLNEEEEKDSEG